MMRETLTRVRATLVLLYVGALLLGGCRTFPRPGPPAQSAAALKQLSLRELMDIEITSVARAPTKLSQTAAAVQVITRDDIRRSGATTLAEALRLATNLQAAQVNSRDWAITARGFNGAVLVTGSIADKLLVMIDGRSIYTPLFGGVFWDSQHVLLDDIDRIEVVSGPGGTLWGANAVNGVINIITRSAEDTQGGQVTLGAGSSLEKYGAARYGGAINPDLFYRVYAQGFDGDATERGPGSGGDDWNFTQSGFRADYRRSASDSVTVQGDAFEGRQGTPDGVYVNGQNMLARWTHVTSPRSEWTAQLYYDRTHRAFPRAVFHENLQTVDFDLQHRFPVGDQHTVVWGAGYRHMWDDVKNGSFSFLPPELTMRLASAFVQDEYAPTGSAVKLTLGTKLEHNDYSGLEVQPSIRVAWTPPGRQMTWAAVSRGVRSPSRLDTDIRTGATRGNPEFDAEKLIAYEIGYRVSPIDALSLSVAAFHNQYTDIRSVNTIPTQPGALIFENDQEATGEGFELSGAYQPTAWWRLRGGYTYLEQSLRSVNPNVLSFSAPFEANDPQYQMLLQSVMDLSRGVQLDVVARHVAELRGTVLGSRIPSYTTADLRLAWRVARWEVAAIAQNLGGIHPEFASPVFPFDIPRSVQGRLTFAW
jgi:iron complex outermembrane receptor protein